MNIPIVQGTEVPPGALSPGIQDHTPYVASEEGNIATFQTETQPRQFQDVPWAILFVGHLVAIFVVISMNLSGFEANGGSSFNGLIAVVGIIAILAIFISSASLGFMMKYPTELVKTSLMFTVGMSLVISLLGFMSGQVWMGVVGLFMFAIGICYARAVWERIPFAAANLNTALTAVKSNMGLTFIAVVMLLLALGWSVVWFAGLGEAISTSNGAIIFLLLLSFYWVHQVLTNVVHVTSAGTVATWWYVPIEAAGCWSTAIQDSFSRAATYSFGSICFGSLLVALVQAMRAAAHMARDNDDAKLLACILDCILALIQDIIEYLNKWAYVYVGIYGFSYLEAGRNVIQLFQQKGWTVIISDDLCDRVLFMVSAGIAFLTGLIGWGIAALYPSLLTGLDLGDGTGGAGILHNDNDKPQNEGDDETAKQDQNLAFSTTMPPPPPPPPPRAGVNSNGRGATWAPPPPPPRQGSAASSPRRTQQAANPTPTVQPRTVQEPYGAVPSTIPATTISQRRTPGALDKASSPPASTFAYGMHPGSTNSNAYVLPPSSYSSPVPSQNTGTTTSLDDENPKYQHNTEALTLIIPSVVSILWWHESPVILQIFLFLGLVLYGLDMVNARDALAVVVWLCALVMTMASGFGTLLQVDDAEATGGTMILYLARLAVEGMLFCTTACWFTLQFGWLYREVPSVATGMEKALHSLLPPVSSTILSYHAARLLMDIWGLDRVATLFPHLFALLMAGGMLMVGSTPSSFLRADSDQSDLPSSITSFSARIHSMVLLMLPGVVHLSMFRQRILSRNANSDELYDIILVWTIPYLFHCGVLTLNSSKSPYEMSNNLFPNRRENTLRGALVAMGVTVLASFAAQQRYLIPFCNRISYQFNGHDLPSTWVVSGYLTLATISTLMALWTWGRKSTVTNELLFGEYHEDIVQLTVSAAGLLLGKAFGFPWNLTPLPILAFLGLSVWITTRMLRYLSIFLFVVHAGGLVLFSYRFASIDIKIPLALSGIEVGLVRFGMIEVIASVVIGLVAGFAVRPPGGVGADLLKRVDIPGMLLVSYAFGLSMLEAILLKRLVPYELMGKESDVGVEEASYLYDHATALLTSLGIAEIAVLCQRLRIVSSKAGIAALSAAIGKAIAVIIDGSEMDGKIRSEDKQDQLAKRFFARAVSASLLLMVAMGPRAVLSPIHVKTGARYKRSISDGKPIGSIPANAERNIYIYTMLILPGILLSTVPMVLTPFVMALSTHYGGGGYYKLTPPMSEMIGLATTIWGVSSLPMLNHYLPDGGAETWKKGAALTFLMGVGITFSAPTVPGWMSGDSGLGLSNPYTAISSMGTTIASQGRSRSGGWGILAASLATLLAVTGPLELRERRHPSGRKDQSLLLRLMVFSLLFGSGVSWFVTIQSMGQENFLVLAITALACMVVSFFGTITSVMAYFLELENFDEAEQMFQMWCVAFLIFFTVTAFPSFFVSSEMHAFGAGGWLSTYLAVSCIAAFSLTMALRLRSAKNQATRGLANSSCVVSYLFAVVVLYGRYGVAGLDQSFAVTTVVGLPASVIGTFVIAPLLLGLEGESSKEKRSRVSRITASNSRSSSFSLGLVLRDLSDSNKFAPLVGATVLVFLLVSLYAIFLRGMPLLGASIPTSHEDLFSRFMGRNNNDLSVLARKSFSRSSSLVTSARLAASGFWTAANPLGPLIHLGGLVATAPGLIALLSYLWSGVKVPKPQVLVALPLNLIPFLFCQSLPSIPAVASIAMIGGLVQLFDLYRSGRRSQMRI